jgi:hypothetical protein
MVYQRMLSVEERRAQSDERPMKRQRTPRPDHSHLQGYGGKPDPLEDQVRQILETFGVRFTRDHPSRLDFYLSDHDLLIEVKRFYTHRIADQLARVPRSDVIVIQGIGALPKLLRALGHVVPDASP